MGRDPYRVARIEERARDPQRPAEDSQNEVDR